MRTGKQIINPIWELMIDLFRCCCFLPKKANLRKYLYFFCRCGCPHHALHISCFILQWSISNSKDGGVNGQCTPTQYDYSERGCLAGFTDQITLYQCIGGFIRFDTNNCIVTSSSTTGSIGPNRIINIYKCGLFLSLQSCGGTAWTYDLKSPLVIDKQRYLYTVNCWVGGEHIVYGTDSSVSTNPCVGGTIKSTSKQPIGYFTCPNCNHGTCQTSDNLLYCLCDGGWNGRFCDQLIPPGTPILTNVSGEVYDTSGGDLVISGDNLGDDVTSVLVQVGESPCINVTVNATTITCSIAPSTTLTPVTHLMVVNISGVTVEPYLYVNVLSTSMHNCASSCKNGTCTTNGCQCFRGYTGINCTQQQTNQTTVNGNNNNGTLEVEIGGSGALYQIRMLRIDEMNIDDVIVNTIDLTLVQWILSTNNETDKWVYSTNFNISKGEGGDTTTITTASMEVKFVFYVNATTVQFSNQQLDINAQTLKATIKIANYTFDGFLNKLSVAFETGFNASDVESCSIEQSTDQFNQDLYTSIQSPKGGLVSRYLSYAEVDTRPVRIETKLLSSTNSSQVAGITIPYFSQYGLVDPDFSIFFNDGDKVGNCIEQEEKSDDNQWRLITGVVVGGIGFIAIAGTIGLMAHRGRWMQKIRAKKVNHSIQME
ncbi:hypothetical protein DFA_06793 [Cavenderia fasciculata]|uniref:IPT/TIG domain-containing protein n=1 Tax=Cavenderia fasciculata TaxID=261658 RepID=F4Q2A6_CACFS|nr:uncharacterized protein DFA_06793 [Cavenderia fasciculata]EGG18126.1 hypothetical protein DFA_06793 [Cavenderia fasciculata]|eukprot:XP_004366167.1 hypothetical protein DFA_06793 [Cavenderia fasciculata]